MATEGFSSAAGGAGSAGVGWEPAALPGAGPPGRMRSAWPAGPPRPVLRRRLGRGLLQSSLRRHPETMATGAVTSSTTRVRRVARFTRDSFVVADGSAGSSLPECLVFQCLTGSASRPSVALAWDRTRNAGLRAAVGNLIWFSLMISLHEFLVRLGEPALRGLEEIHGVGNLDVEGDVFFGAEHVAIGVAIGPGAVATALARPRPPRPSPVPVLAAALRVAAASRVAVAAVGASRPAAAAVAAVKGWPAHSCRSPRAKRTPVINSSPLSALTMALSRREGTSKYQRALPTSFDNFLGYVRAVAECVSRSACLARMFDGPAARAETAIAPSPPDTACRVML